MTSRTGNDSYLSGSGSSRRSCPGLPWAEDHGAEQFRSFSRLTSALCHYEFHDREQVVTEAWDKVGDDPGVAAELTGLLDGANYTPVTMAELEDALANESLIRMRLKVDLDDYDELLIYRRGSQQDTVEIPKWKGLRSEERTFHCRQTGGGIHASEAPKLVR